MSGTELVKQEHGNTHTVTDVRLLTGFSNTAEAATPRVAHFAARFAAW